MKILFIVPSLARGGAERVVVRLSKELSKENEVDILIYRNRIEYEVPRSANVHVLQTEGISMLSRMKNTFIRTKEIRKLLSERHYDVVVSFLGNLPPILSGRRVIVSVRNNPLKFPLLAKLQLYTFYHFPNVVKVVAVSEKLSEILRKNFFLEKSVCIPNPIDLEEVEEKIKAVPPPFDFPYILSVGRLHPQKNFQLLIKAYARSGLRRKYRLVILGEGNERAKLQKLISKLSLEGKVLLPGKVSNPYIYMRHAKFFVLSSDYEGFPNALIEALACGTPVIATRCDTGPEEIIQQEKNGLLVPVRDEEALANAMERLDGDQGLYTRCKNYSRESIRKFDIKIITQKWISLFEEVINEKEA